MRSFRGVRGGTPTGEPLCRSCTFASYRVGARQGEQILICSKLDHRAMPFEAFECSTYDDKRIPQIWDMERRAWILVELGKGRRKFVASDEYQDLLSKGKVQRTPDES